METARSIDAETAAKVLREAKYVTAISEDIVGRFNAHLETTLLLGVEEAFAPQNRAADGTLAVFIDRTFRRQPPAGESTMLVDHLRQRPDHLAAAIDLIAARRELFESIKEGAVARLEAKAEEAGWTLERADTPTTLSGYSMIDLELPGQNLIFSFAAPLDDDWAFVGLQWRDKDKHGHAFKPGAMAGLNAVLGKSGAPEPRWPWWRHVEAGEYGLADVKTLSSIWTAINDGADFVPAMFSAASQALSVLKS